MNANRPASPRRQSRADLLRIYRETSTIAVVGASTKPGRPAHDIPAYLHAHGYRILPVNPRGGELFGEKVHRSLAEIDEAVDVVDVFRPPEEGPEIAHKAASIGAKVVWFQPGTQSAEATAVATDAGLVVVTRFCMGSLHGALGLGPGPDHHDAG
jgi:uncharacterized protein